MFYFKINAPSWDKVKSSLLSLLEIHGDKTYCVIFNPDPGVNVIYVLTTIAHWKTVRHPDFFMEELTKDELKYQVQDMTIDDFMLIGNPAFPLTLWIPEKNKSEN